ncbi:MAG: hydrogenase maturation protease [Planctomycetes bacterium]|nr:hydrogenase maturation protease [Planctomycetota bacterium]
MKQRAPKLFLGVGNVLKHDEGVGVRAAEILGALSLPDDVEVCDAGTLGIDTAAVLEGRELVVVVDALDAGAEPGAVFRLTPGQIAPTIRGGFSVHDFHFLDALDETRLLGREPSEVIVFGVQVADVSTGLGLTAPVERALTRVVKLAGRELGVPEKILQQATTLESSWSA